MSEARATMKNPATERGFSISGLGNVVKGHTAVLALFESGPDPDRYTVELVTADWPAVIDA